MAKPRIFISYDNDKHYKNILLAWEKNDEFDFAFNDHSAGVSIQSTNAEEIKRAISAKINSGHALLVHRRIENERECLGGPGR